MHREGKESIRNVPNSVSSIDVANVFLERARADGAELYPSKLIKLVVIAHGWTLAHTRIPLINDDVYAWSGGPVPTHLYSVLIDKFGSPLPADVKLYDDELASSELSEIELEIIESTYEQYGIYSAEQLAEMTHEFGTPWAKYHDPKNPDIVIPQDVIRDHYADLLKASRIEPLWKSDPDLLRRISAHDLEPA